jgi:hypothetical protein
VLCLCFVFVCLLCLCFVFVCYNAQKEDQQYHTENVKDEKHGPHQIKHL